MTVCGICGSAAWCGCVWEVASAVGWLAAVLLCSSLGSGPPAAAACGSAVWCGVVWDVAAAPPGPCCSCHTSLTMVASGHLGIHPPSPRIQVVPAGHWSVTSLGGGGGGTLVVLVVSPGSPILTALPSWVGCSAARAASPPVVTSRVRRHLPAVPLHRCVPASLAWLQG